MVIKVVVGDNQSKSFVDNKLNPVLDILSNALKGNYHRRLKPQKNQGEISDLYTLINKLIEKLEEYAQNEKYSEIQRANTYEFYEQILSCIDCGVFITDRDDVITYANRAMQEISGSEMRNIVGKVLIRDFSREFMKSFRPYYLKAKKSKRNVFLDTVPISFSREKRIFNTGWLIPIVNDNSFEGMICTSMDVTEQRIVEDAKKECRERLENIFSSSPGIIFTTDPKGNFIDVNSALSKILDLSFNEIKKKNIMDIFVGTEKENIKGVLDKLNNGEEIRGVEVSAKLGTNEKHYFRINANPMNEYRNAGSFIFLPEDITEFKKMTEELKSSRHRFRSLFDSSVISLWEEDYSDVFSLLDDIKLQGVDDIGSYIKNNPYFTAQAAQRVHITDANQNTLRLFKARSKDDILKSLSMFFFPETTEKFRDQLIAMVEGKKRISGSFVMKNAEGEKIEVIRSMALPSNMSFSKKSVVSFLNITDSKMSNKER